MKRFALARLFAVLVVIFAATACDPAEVPANSAPLPILPAVQATAANQSAANSAAALSIHETLQQSLSKTKNSAAYRMNLNFVMGTTNGLYAEQPFLKFDAEINGNASRVIYTGGAFNEMLGGGERIEVISIANQSYLKGSNLFGAADPDTWYLLADSTLSKPPFDLDDMLRQLGDGLDQAKVVGTEKVDGMACQTWFWDFKTKAGVLLDLAGADNHKDESNIVDRAEARFTQCADGFVHGLTWNVQTHDKNSANDKGSLNLGIHLFDFNAANIAVKAPDGAIELR